jgi:hypothetical protein
MDGKDTLFQEIIDSPEQSPTTTIRVDNMPHNDEHTAKL